MQRLPKPRQWRENGQGFRVSTDDVMAEYTPENFTNTPKMNHLA